MENRSYALLTGFFTIALTIAAILAGIWFNRDRSERVPYLIATSQSVPGLNPQATVRYRGIQVGKVADIDFDDKHPGLILIRLDVDPDTPVTKTTFATLGYQGVTGIAYIQLDDDKTDSPRLATNEKNPARIPLNPGLLDQLDKRGRAILDRTEKLMDQLNALTGPANQERVGRMLDNAGDAAQTVNQAVQHMAPALEKLPDIAGKLDRTLDQVNGLAGSATRLTNHLDEVATGLNAPNGPLNRLNTTLDRVGGSVEGIAREVEYQTLPSVNATTDDARGTLRAVKRTMNTLNDRPQSLLFGGPSVKPGPGEPGFTAPNK